MKKTTPSSADMDLFISLYLRWGALGAAILILAGWLGGLPTVLTLGLWCLVALPVGRVLSLFVFFTIKKNYIFAFISATVLAILSWSFIWALLHP